MFAKKEFEREYPVGLMVYKYSDDENYTITGMLAREYRFREFDGAYELEDYIQAKVDCTGIEFDSEYSQFFAYAKTQARAVGFVQDVQAWFDNLKQLIA